MAETSAEFAARIKRQMFNLGMPVGSDDPEARRMGAPPLHVCDPDTECRICPQGSDEP